MAGAKITYFGATKPAAPQVVEGETGADNTLNGAGNATARRRRIVFEKTRLGKGGVEVKGQPGQQLWRAMYAARSAGFGGAGVFDEHDLGVKVEHEHRKGAEQIIVGLGADIRLGAFRADQERDRRDRREVTGSMVVTVPRASLLWKPVPALR